MRAIRLAPLILAPLLLAAAPTPEAAWKQGIADQNRFYAQVPHAMLKIQDSVYLGEGQSAVLEGRKGQAGSWRWNSKPGAKGPLTLAIKGGRISITHDGKAVPPAQLQKSVVVDTGVDISGQPTQVGAGVEGWRIFVFNQQHPAAKAFKTVSYFPYDPAFRVTARFVADTKLPPRVFKTSRGTDKQFFHAGDAVFRLKGKDVRLPFYTGGATAKDVTDMSAFFNDELSNRGVYGAGCYVDVAGFGAFPPKSVTIDFNNAYNPNCALSPHFTCPLAVDAIPVAMTVGERDPHAKH
jgi:uncharacterized protein (DUF1684 family)